MCRRGDPRSNHRLNAPAGIKSAGPRAIPEHQRPLGVVSDGQQPNSAQPRAAVLGLSIRHSFSTLAAQPMAHPEKWAQTQVSTSLCRLGRDRQSAPRIGRWEGTHELQYAIDAKR